MLCTNNTQNEEKTIPSTGKRKSFPALEIHGLTLSTTLPWLTMPIDCRRLSAVIQGEDPDDCPPVGTNQDPSLDLFFSLAQQLVKKPCEADFRTGQADSAASALLCGCDAFGALRDALKRVSEDAIQANDQLLNDVLGVNDALSPFDRAGLLWDALESPRNERVSSFHPIQRVFQATHSKELAVPMMLFNFWEYLHRRGYVLQPVDCTALSCIALGEATKGPNATIEEGQDALTVLVLLAHRLAPDAHINVEALVLRIRQGFRRDALGDDPPLCQAIAALVDALMGFDLVRTQGNHPRRDQGGIYMFDPEDPLNAPILDALEGIRLPRWRELAEVCLFNFWNYLDMHNKRA